MVLKNLLKIDYSKEKTIINKTIDLNTHNYKNQNQIKTPINSKK